MKEIKNFSKCELNVTYQVNGHELVITSTGKHKFGHYLYSGTVDGAEFAELNSPQLKAMLGMDTIPYDRDGSGGGVPKPSGGKEITEDGIKIEVDKIATKINKVVEQLRPQVSDDVMVAIENILFDEIKRKQDDVRESLMLRMIEQQKAKEARANKAREREQEEQLKERCAAIGTTYKNIKAMADAMGVSVEEMLTNMEGMRR